MEKKNQLAINDEQLRKENAERVIGVAEKIGNFAESGEKTTKAFSYYIYIILFIVLVSVIGGVVYAGSNADNFSEFMSAMFGNTELYNYNIVCYDSNGKNITIGTLENAKNFKESIGGTCNLV